MKETHKNRKKCLVLVLWVVTPRGLVGRY